MLWNSYFIGDVRNVSKTYLRNVTQQDIELLFEWANDYAVRKNSFNTEQILFEDHVRWFNKMMSDEDVLQFIMMVDDTPVGQIRFVINKDEAEIGYSIAKEYRGKGYGHKILQLSTALVSEEYPGIHKLIAKVKPDNAASNKLFLNEQYEIAYLCYFRNL